jgi:hypothetical protein
VQNATGQAELNALSSRQVAEQEANRIRDVDCRALIEKLIASNAVLLAENIALQVTSRINDGALASKDLQLAQLNLHCSELTLERDEQREEVSTLRARNDTLQAELRDLNFAMYLTVCCPSPSSVCLS